MIVLKLSCDCSNFAACDSFYLGTCDPPDTAVICDDATSSGTGEFDPAMFRYTCEKVTEVAEYGVMYHILNSGPNESCKLTACHTL